ncbi:MAG TPA: hypothetical protein VJR58_06365 [Vineibacter sp.]|nr:hypothetical protein [Vineibacter sp.]
MFVTMFQDGQYAGGKKEAWAQVRLQIAGQVTAGMKEGLAPIAHGTWRAGLSSHVSPDAPQEELDKMTITPGPSTGKRVWRHNFLTAEMEFAQLPPFDTYSDYRKPFSNPCVMLRGCRSTTGGDWSRNPSESRPASPSSPRSST